MKNKQQGPNGFPAPQHVVKSPQGVIDAFLNHVGHKS